MSKLTEFGKRIMKKIIYLLLCITLIFSISSCEDSGRIALTKYNYSEYINIDVYVTDYSFIISEETDVSTIYKISVVVHIETSKKVDCTFEGVSITYSPPKISSWTYAYDLSSPPKATLNIEGESHTSYVATKSEARSINNSISKLTSTNNIVQSIEGFVVLKN